MSTSGIDNQKGFAMPENCKIGDIPQDYSLVTNSQDIHATLEHIGRLDLLGETGSIFAKIVEGEYEAIYRSPHSVPVLTFSAYRIFPPVLVKFGAHFIGCVLDCSSYSAHDLDERILTFAQSHGYKLSAPLPDSEIVAANVDKAMEAVAEYDEALSEEADSAVDWLNGQDLLSYCSFYIDDNSLFYGPSIESAQEDVGFRSSREQEYPGDDYEGEWLHVNDHGNATLYVRQAGEDREIWGVV
jgi:hypothetical protein